MNGGNDGADDSGGGGGGGLAREFAATWLAAPAELVEDGGRQEVAGKEDRSFAHTRIYTPRPLNLRRDLSLSLSQTHTHPFSCLYRSFTLIYLTF